MNMGNLLIMAGITLLIFGLLFNAFGKFHLPGDIKIQKDSFVFYFPITTSIIVGLVLTYLIHLLRR